MFTRMHLRIGFNEQKLKNISATMRHYWKKEKIEELEAKEKRLEEKETKSHLSIAKREVVVAVKGKDLLDTKI